MELKRRANIAAESAANQFGDYSEVLDAAKQAYIVGAVQEKHLYQGECGSFGKAIESLKLGCRVTRKGWNGKGMFLWLKPATMVKSEWCKDPLLKELADNNGGEVEALGTICMKTADNKILTGWLASQTDILSDDWMLSE